MSEQPLKDGDYTMVWDFDRMCYRAVSTQDPTVSGYGDTRSDAIDDLQATLASKE